MIVYDQEQIQYNFLKYYVFCVAHFMVHKVLVLYLLSIFFSHSNINQPSSDFTTFSSLLSDL